MIVPKIAGRMAKFGLCGRVVHLWKIVDGVEKLIIDFIRTSLLL